MKQLIMEIQMLQKLVEWKEKTNSQQQAMRYVSQQLLRAGAGKEQRRNARRFIERNWDEAESKLEKGLLALKMLSMRAAHVAGITKEEHKEAVRRNLENDLQTEKVADEMQFIDDNWEAACAMN